jgi:hypothetical protein
LFQIDDKTIIIIIIIVVGSWQLLLVLLAVVVGSCCCCCPDRILVLATGYLPLPRVIYQGSVARPLISRPYIASVDEGGPISLSVTLNLTAEEMSRDLLVDVCVASLTGAIRLPFNKALEIIEDEGIRPQVFKMASTCKRNEYVLLAKMMIGSIA